MADNESPTSREVGLLRDHLNTLTTEVALTKMKETPEKLAADFAAELCSWMAGWPELLDTMRGVLLEGLSPEEAMLVSEELSETKMMISHLVSQAPEGRITFPPITDMLLPDNIFAILDEQGAITLTLHAEDVEGVRQQGHPSGHVS